MDKRCYVVTYDICSPKRWRKVFRLMMGFGEHVQLSVFRCDLTREQRVRMRNRLDEEIDHRDDQVIIVDVGPSRRDVVDEIEVLGKSRAFELPASTIL
ncbi:MAG: CRISPR-associated endonuclease Cas2 [Thermoanaerobaculia bacterium]|nr:CRISPR-associated endonuclease Cas2 [Thermoanaerobaculia bacterium]